MSKSDQAVALFNDGYNCAQAIIKAFGDDLGIDDNMAKTLGRPLGGGIGHLGEMCGALTGATVVLAHYPALPKDENDARRELHSFVQILAAKFRKKNGCLNCRDLLGVEIGTQEGMKKIVEEKLVARRCPGFVEDAANFVEDAMG